MGIKWTNVPPTAAVTIEQRYAWIIQFWRAMAERAKIFNSVHWPRLNFTWWTGKISSAATSDGNVILTVDTTDAELEAHRWYNYTPPVITPESSTIPKYYDVMIELNGRNPDAVIRGQIIADNDETTLTIPSLENYIQCGYLSSLSDLADKPYYIIKRDGIWWGDTFSPAKQRWPIHPNDRMLDKGSKSTPPTIDSKLIANGSTTGTSWKFSVDGWYNGAPIDWTAKTPGGTTIGTGTGTPSGGFLTITLSNPTSINYTDYPVQFHTNVLQTIEIIPSDNPNKYPWKVNQFAGKDMIITVGSSWKRISITGNTSHVLIFSAQTTEPSGDWIILNAGGKGVPGRRATYPAQSYTGAMDIYYSHFPNDSISTFGFASPTVTWNEGDPSEPVSHAVFDNDDAGWSFINELGSEPDKCYAPWFYHSIRAIQVEIESTCSNYVAPIDYSGKKRINNFTPATMFNFAGINSGTTTLSATDDADTWTFSVAADYKSVGIVWTLIGPHDEIITNGNTVADGDGLCTISVGHDESRTYAGFQVVYSAGWSREWPKMLRYMFDRCAFIPDLEDDGFGGLTVKDAPGIIDWETDGPAGVGQWINREKSANLLTYGDYGFASDGGEVVADLANNTAVRYMGDNHQDPGTGLTVPAGDGTTSNEILLPYWDRFFEGTHAKEVQAQIVKERVGEATSGGKNFVRDESRNWWSWWYGGGVLRTESGTAVSGTATTLVIEAYKTDLGDERSSWWLADRFNGFSAPYVGFVLEVDQTETIEGVPTTVTYRHLITNFDSGTRTVTITGSTGFSVATGNAYRIREPKYNLNRYRGKKLALTEPDGTTHTVIINGNDDKNLYFDTQSFTVAAGWKYRIIEPDRGAVYLRDSADAIGWKLPTGTDPRGPKWRENSNFNRPYKTDGFGRYCKFDIFSIKLCQELYDAINALIWVKRSIIWSGRADPEVPENNVAKIYDSHYYSNYEPFHRHGTYGDQTWDGWGWAEYVDPPGLTRNETFDEALAEELNDLNSILDDAELSEEDTNPPLSGAPYQYTTMTNSFYMSEPTWPSDKQIGGVSFPHLFSRYSYATADASKLLTCKNDFYGFYARYGDPTSEDEKVTSTLYSNQLTDEWSSFSFGFEFRTWNTWDTDHVNSDDDGKVTSIKLGSAELSPDNLPEIDVPNGTTITANYNTIGWIVADACAIQKYNVEGGLEYVAELI